MKIFIFFIIWFVVGLVGSQTLQNHQYALFVICAISFPILSLMLLFRIFGLLLQGIGKLFSPKKKYRELGILEKGDVYNDSSVEHITLDHQEYIGFLTKIDKKRIAEQYLAEQKRREKHERK
ncbi:MAG: hypothetical protein ACREHC_08225 [Candidatus Levyibacteriota bacterium]